MIHLKEIRQQKGITAERLAEISNLTKTQIWSYESGRREPPLASLIAIADALGISLDLLVRGKEKEPPKADLERLQNTTADAISRLPPEAREIALAVLATLRSPSGE